MINSRITAKHIIRSGIIINNLNFKDQAFNYLYPATGMELQPLSYRGGSLNLLQAYFQYKYNINENLSLSQGFHFLYLLSNQQYSIEPRLAFRWEIAGNHVLSLGFGIHGITQTPQIYNAEVFSEGEITLPNKNLGVTRSYQAVMGYDWLFHENWRLKTEIYYQYITDAPSSLDNPTLSLINFNNSGNVFVTSTYKGSGKGINYGLELSIEKFMSRGFYLLLTASLYDSLYLDGNKVWRNTHFNGYYATNLLAGKEFRFGKKKNSSFSISGKITWLGGQRYTPIDIGLSSLAHQAVYIDSLAFSSKFDDFFKIDLRIRYRLNRKKVSHEFAFELGNVLNRKNIENIRFDRYTNTVKYNYDLPLVPLVQYRIEL